MGILHHMEYALCMQAFKNIYLKVSVLHVIACICVPIQKTHRGHVLWAAQFIIFISPDAAFLSSWGSKAPPQRRNTEQHNSLLLKIDPCEVTHSGKQSVRETNNAVREQEEESTLAQDNGWIPCWFHLFICFSEANWAVLQWHCQTSRSTAQDSAGVASG